MEERTAKLADHGDVGAGAEGLHEGLGAGLGDGADVVDEVGLGHADTGVADGEAVVLLVRGDADVELLFGLEHRGVGERIVAHLVERIGRVGDELTQEDLLVRVEGVDDEVEQLADVGGLRNTK